MALAKHWPNRNLAKLKYPFFCLASLAITVVKTHKKLPLFRPQKHNLSKKTKKLVIHILLFFMYMYILITIKFNHYEKENTAIN